MTVQVLLLHNGIIHLCGEFKKKSTEQKRSRCFGHEIYMLVSSNCGKDAYKFVCQYANVFWKYRLTSRLVSLRISLLQKLTFLDNDVKHQKPNL